jgi:putative endonuclease
MRSYDRHDYCVYILTNRSKTLYVGVTGNLHRRVWQHKHGSGSEFCQRYKIDRLVYYESFDDVVKAINREKQIKGLLRIKKIQLIVSMNPTWRDLSEEWYTRHVYQPTECIDPSLRSG